MDLDKTFLHNLTLDLLYASVVLLTFVILERLVYFIYLGIQARKIGQITHRAGLEAASRLQQMEANDLLTRSIREYVEVQRLSDTSRSRIEDMSAALYLRVDGKVNARLWVLDTIVTAAPLMGLLGTILGIMDTFNALSAGGISDPEAVSRGIGSALFATALGIATALYGLVGHNVLHRQSDMITENFKCFLLEATFEPKTLGRHPVAHETRATAAAESRQTAAASAA